MKYYLTILALFLTLQASAQLSIGSEGITVLASTTLTVDGLTLIPSANLTIANNSIQESSTPIAQSPSINRVYQFASPVPFSGTVGINYLTAELNGYKESALQVAYAPVASTTLTVTSGSLVNLTNHYVTNTITNKNLFVVTATALSDLTPNLFARPTTVNGDQPFSVVVDVYELNRVATPGTVSVKITQDSKVNLTFDPSATTVGGKPVQNSAWSYGGLANGFYTLTTNQPMPASGLRSVGLSGMLVPGATEGSLTVSTIAILNGFPEARLNNNSDADKVDYFQQ